MKKIIIKLCSTIAKLLLCVLLSAGLIAAYGGAVLQESYKLHPLSSAELAEASGEAQLLSLEDLNK